MPGPVRAGQFGRLSHLARPGRLAGLGHLTRRSRLTRLSRRGEAGRLARRARDTGLAVLVAAPAVIVIAGVALIVACSGSAHVSQSPAAGQGSSAASSQAGLRLAGTGRSLRAGSPAAGSSQAGLRTSCREVMHIGDSTSEGMVSPVYLSNPAQRLTAQYQDVGVQTVRTNIVGANSVAETLPGDTNGYNAARDVVAGGYHGCWVLALGTNDTADVAIGSPVSRLARIEQMMSVAHGQPVLWVNVVSILSSGPYSETNMQLWNDALQQACQRYPNMRVFNWASLVQQGWFINDGIHYTPAGYATRAQQIAQALAKAFPAKGRSKGCAIS
jgi:lysophospholipase L1-like esterase